MPVCCHPIVWKTRQTDLIRSSSSSSNSSKLKFCFLFLLTALDQRLFSYVSQYGQTGSWLLFLLVWCCSMPGVHCGLLASIWAVSVAVSTHIRRRHLTRGECQRTRWNSGSSCACKSRSVQQHSVRLRLQAGLSCRELRFITLLFSTSNCPLNRVTKQKAMKDLRHLNLSLKT